MNEEPDKRLLTANEWADLMDAEYKAQGSPVDAVAKARVWRRVESQMKPRGELGTRTRQVPWTALAAGIVAIAGVTHLLRQSDGWIEKGDAPSIPTTLTPYVLAKDGSTIPADNKIPSGTTVVFRVRASQNGVYAFLVSEGGAPPRLAIDDGERIGVDDQLVKKGGSIYGIKMETTLRGCVVAGRNRDELNEQLKALNSVFEALPRESCVLLEALPP